MKYNLVMKMKDRLPYGARVLLGKGSRRLRYAALVLASGARPADRACPVCDRQILGFVHGGVLCPFCTSFPRHRALQPLVGRWVGSARGAVSLMHVAPDACMRARLIETQGLRYLGVDRFTPGHYYPPDTIHGDLENLDLDSDSQDLVICLHVLEHVEDDRRALREMHRVLKPGGIAILAFPFRKGQPTYEDPTIVDPRDREAAFGRSPARFRRGRGGADGRGRVRHRKGHPAGHLDRRRARPMGPAARRGLLLLPQARRAFVPLGGVPPMTVGRPRRGRPGAVPARLGAPHRRGTATA